MSNLVGEQEPVLDVFGFFRLLSTRLVLLATITGLVTLLAAIYAFVVEPTYRSSILLAPVKSIDGSGGLSSLASQFGGVASLAGISLQGGDDQSERSFAILNSRQFIAMFIEENNLLPVLFADKWDRSAESWLEKYSDDPPTMTDAVKKFERYVLDSSRDGKSGFVSIDVEWSDPDTAAEWANSYTKLLNNHLRRKDIEKTERSISYLKSEYEKASVNELRVSIANLIEQQIKSAMIAKVNDDYAYDILDRAVPSAKDDPIRPKKLLVILTGFFLGLVLSVVVVLVQSEMSRSAANVRQVD